LKIKVPGFLRVVLNVDCSCYWSGQ
jgi:hypothetical protein